MGGLLVMVTRVLVCLLVVSLLPSVASGEVAPSSTVASRAELVAGNAQFALGLYGRVARGGGNAVVSPLSVSIASAMLYAGARGGTEAEIANALGFSLPQSALHVAFADLLSDLHKRVKPWAKLVIASGAWVDRCCVLTPAFADLLSSRYDATTEAVDFGRAPAEAARSINDWVTNVTDGKITSVVNPSMFDEDTRLTMVNAVYFLAAWEHRFAVDATRDESFHLPDDAIVPVPMMHRSCVVPYYDDESVQVLELPYQGGGISMVLVLPRTGVDLALVEERLSPELLSKWLGGLARRGVDVAVPRFETASRINLVPILVDLGMKRAFRPMEADLTGICPRRDLYVGRADHLVTIGITERGTEAAAATVYIVYEDIESEPDD